jgi:hypothetical protein
VPGIAAAQWLSTGFMASPEFRNLEIMQALELLISSIQEMNRGEEFHALLAAKINELITTNFPALIQLLYRLDISEAKLKQLTRDHSQEETAAIIATLIIERQIQKLKSRQQYKNPGTSDEERW